MRLVADALPGANGQTGSAFEVPKKASGQDVGRPGEESTGRRKPVGLVLCERADIYRCPLDDGARKLLVREGLGPSDSLQGGTMQMGNHSFPARRWGQIGLVALLGLTLALVTVTTGHASAGHAVTAKKKCKKKKHRSASSRRRRRSARRSCTRWSCRRPAPLVRATLSWSPAASEVDLHAFDCQRQSRRLGLQGEPPERMSREQHPERASQRGRGSSAGRSESFTDDIYVIGGPSNREFSYVACLYDGPRRYTATFTGVTRGGHDVHSVSLSGPDAISLTTAGGPPIPFNPCCNRLTRFSARDGRGPAGESRPVSFWRDWRLRWAPCQPQGESSQQAIL